MGASWIVIGSYSKPSCSVLDTFRRFSVGFSEFVSDCERKVVCEFHTLLHLKQTTIKRSRTVDTTAVTFLVRIGTSLLPTLWSHRSKLVFVSLCFHFKEQEEIRNKIYVTGGGYISFTGIWWSPGERCFNCTKNAQKLSCTRWSSHVK